MRTLNRESTKCPFWLRYSLTILILCYLSACAANPSKNPDWHGYAPEQAVQNRIALDPRLNDLRILVNYSDGTVTITGEVTSLGQKVVAEEGLYQVTGVHTVVNNLTVKASDIRDSDIAHNILVGIPAHCLVNVKDIRVKVKDGQVKITGRSKGMHHKDVVMNIAKFSPGVRSVDNQIRVLPDPTEGNPTDLQIKKNVEGVIWSFSLDTANIQAEVTDGVVELTGTAPSYERITSLETALRDVPGVVQVKNEIREPNRFYRLFWHKE